MARTNKDFDAIQRHAHTLKGICRTFDVEEAADAAFKLEQAGKDRCAGTEDQLETLAAELTRATEAVSQLAVHL